MASSHGDAAGARRRVSVLLKQEGGSLPDRDVIFFGGKGGVGKTTLACAYALGAAERHLKTLLVSTDPAHSTGDMLETSLTDEPLEVVPNLWALEIDPAREADRYIDDVKRRLVESTAPRLMHEVERQIDIARVSPGAEEAALFDRFARILDEASGRYDRVVFDTAPTGHTIRLLSLPELMGAWISGLISRRRKVNVLARMWRNVAGAAAGDEPDRADPVLEALRKRKVRFEHARATLTDAARTAFVFVLIPERLPILETAKAVEVLAKYQVPVGGIVVNRVLPAESDGVFLKRRREREQQYLEEIERTFARFDIYRLPLRESDVVGIEALRTLLAELPASVRTDR